MTSYSKLAFVLVSVAACGLPASAKSTVRQEIRRRRDVAAVNGMCSVADMWWPFSVFQRQSLA
jgi:hypothetical protein